MDIDIAQWHPLALGRVAQALAGKRLAHAQLVCGVPGIGKRAFARWLARLLLCERPELEGHVRFCDVCKSCRLTKAGTHPDLMLLTPEESARSIGVDAVRAFSAQLALTAQLSGNRVGILDPADTMTTNAANGLLKSLEEPPPGTYLILISDFPARLLATIRSRCQRIELHKPEAARALLWLTPQVAEQQAERWLNIARGAPLRALELAQDEHRTFRDGLFETFVAVLDRETDPVKAAGVYARAPLAPLLSCLDSWISDLIRLTVAGPDTQVCNSDLGEVLARHYGKLDLRGLFRYLDRLRDTATGPVALNTQLVVEELFISASRLGIATEG